MTLQHTEGPSGRIYHVLPFEHRARDLAQQREWLRINIQSLLDSAGPPPAVEALTEAQRCLEAAIRLTENAIGVINTINTSSKRSKK